jgi:hypothetical protein
MRNGGRFDSRFTIIIFGIVVLFAAVVALAEGQRNTAVMGFIVGGAMVICNEWWVWRRRQ